jgi:hypothetical protein
MRRTAVVALSIMIILAIGLSMTGCKEPNLSIVGTWSMFGILTYTFNGDGTFSRSSFIGTSESGTYLESGGTLALHISVSNGIPFSGDETYSYSISSDGDTLRIYDSGSTDVSLTRQ